MKTIDLETARNYARNSSTAWINSSESTKVFGEKGGHTAFFQYILRTRTVAADNPFKFQRSISLH